MESDQFSRTRLVIGDEGIKRLQDAKVCVFGVGGVGGYVVEGLARAGVGHLVLVDHDTVSLSNLNRQIIALHSTLGKRKVEVAQERVLDINPACDVEVHTCFYLPDTASQFDFPSYDYVVDAVDTVTAKISIIMQCERAHVPVISAMGAGNKLDPTRFRFADIYQTSVDPLARVLRRELKKRGVSRLKVLYSTEVPVKHEATEEADARTPGSVSFVPSVAGLEIAGEIVKDLLARQGLQAEA